MKRLLKSIKLKDILFCLIVALIFCLPILSSSLYRGNDTPFHMSRITGVAEGLRTRTFPIYIYPYTNIGFGYGSPMFYCDLFLVLPAILYILGVPIVVIYKLIIFVFVFIASRTSYYLFSYIFKDKKISILCVILYCFTNVLPLYYYVSSGVGVMMTLSFLPLLLLSWYKLFIEKDNCWILLGVSFALILLTHLLTFTIAVILFAIFVIIDYKSFNKDRFACILKATILALGLTLFYLLPMIEQLFSQDFWVKFLNANQNVSWLSGSQMPVNVIFNDFIFGGTVLSKFHLGILLDIITFLAYLILKVKNKKFCQYDVLFLIFIIGTIIQLDFIPTEYIKFLVTFQFTWRINVFLLPFSIYLMGKCLEYYDKKIINVVIVLIIIYLSINNFMYYLNIKNDANNTFLNNNMTYDEIIEPGVKEVEETHYVNYYEIGQGEYLPYTNSYQYCNASTNIIAANDDEIIFDYNRVGTTIIFNTNLDYDMNLYMPLSWYKGYYYQELDDNGSVLYENQCGYSEYTKRVEVPVTGGNHTYKVYYKGTIIQKISLATSIISFIWLCVCVVRRAKVK